MTHQGTIEVQAKSHVEEISVGRFPVILPPFPSREPGNRLAQKTPETVQYACDLPVVSESMRILVAMRHRRRFHRSAWR